MPIVELKVGHTYTVLGTDYKATVLHKIADAKYLFIVPNNYATPFIIWTVEGITEAGISCIWGHYYTTLARASKEVKQEKPTFGENLMQRLRQREGLDKRDDSEDDEINNRYSSREALDNALCWEGIIGYDYLILLLIDEAFGTNLADQ